MSASMEWKASQDGTAVLPVGIRRQPLDLLEESRSHAWGPNIGLRGARLSILVSMVNGLHSAERTVRSLAERLPTFAGEVVVGCAPADAQRVPEWFGDLSCGVQVVEIDASAGVAAQRNRLVTAARRPWLLFLEGVELVGDPLNGLQTQISLRGCQFWSMPLLLADGQSVLPNGGTIPASPAGDRLLAPAEDAPFSPGSAGPFCTFLAGGTALVSREAILAIGGWDETLSGGLEDLDLSVRLYRAGLKVGVAPSAALARTFPYAGSRVDLAAVARRFALKHGIQVHVEESRAARRRPRIALVVDTDSWAFANIARQLVRYLSDRFEFQIVPLVDRECADQALLAVAGADLVHLFWRDVLRTLGGPESRAWAHRLGTTLEAMRARMGSPVLTTAVYDHLYLGAEDVVARAPLMRSVAAYCVCSQRLDRIYRELPGYPPPAAVLADGVDLSLFRPRRMDRFDDIATREIVVGWAGNSRWVAEVEDFKGLHSILRPALEQLAAEGVRLRPLFADRAERFVPQREMPDYYSQIDVYVCPSKIEGTPNPVLEAMACGVPVISTDVGVVPEAFGPEQSRFILAERSVECLKDALRRLAGEPAAFRRLSRENLEMIQGWDWRHRAMAFAPFFERALARSAPLSAGA